MALRSVGGGAGAAAQPREEDGHWAVVSMFPSVCLPLKKVTHYTHYFRVNSRDLERETLFVDWNY